MCLVGIAVDVGLMRDGVDLCREREQWLTKYLLYRARLSVCTIRLKSPMLTYLLPTRSNAPNYIPLPHRHPLPAPPQSHHPHHPVPKYKAQSIQAHQKQVL